MCKPNSGLLYKALLKATRQPLLTPCSPMHELNTRQKNLVRSPANSLSTAETSRSSASALHSGARKNCAKRSSPPCKARGSQSNW